MLGEKLSERYEILSELGRGGMGVVYRARDPLLNREVAVKVIAPAMLTPETEQRFQTEAQLVAKMDHPSIVPIYDFGRHEGSLFFVMPIVEGESLRFHQRKGELTLGTVVDIGIQIADALDYSHTRGVVHRDIKPENVMVTTEEGIRVRIMDFGLARGTNVATLTLTKTGMVMGTLWYISPEQVTGRAVDGRTDIYSLGSVLYECLVNEVPFTGEIQSLFYRIVHEMPQSPRSLGCPIDEELDRILLQCLEKDPAQRPQKAGDLSRALRKYRSQMRDSQQKLTIMASRASVAPRPAMSPFIGRENEFRELQQRLNSAVRGECQFVAVSGEPGVGKSRLMDELCTLAAARQITVLHGRLVEQHGAFPYHGFCEAIQEFFQQKELGGSTSALPDLTDVAADLVALFPMLSEISVIRAAVSGGISLSGSGESRSAENRTEVFELLARTLIRLAGGKPLVLAFEDLHGGGASIEALQYIVRRLGPTPTLIVCTYRSTEIDRGHPVTQMIEGFQGDRKFAAVSLGPLSAADHRAFLSTLTGGTQVAERLALKLFEATEGNPFFTKELVRSLLDSGSIAQDDTGTWSLSGGTDISPDILPATIQQAVETRIGRLPDALRDILSISSVMGKSFEFEDLESVYDGESDLDDAVDRLIQEGLLEEDRQTRGDRLSFTSTVVREVLYAGLSRRKRRSLHLKFAQRLEKRLSGKLERVYPQLLYHYYEADEPEKSVEYGLLHAKKSLESFSPEEVIRAARTALEFLEEDWDGDTALEGEARMLLASGHRMAGDLMSALREIAGAVKVFEREKQPVRAVEALLAAAKAAWQVRETEEARRWVERGLDAARAANQVEITAQFLTLAATLANLRGEYARAGEYLKEAEQLTEGSRRTSGREEVPRGGHLVVGLANQFTARAPVDMQLTEEFEVFSNVFETLIVTDEEGNLHPAVCESWEVLRDGKAFRFAIRPGIRFHDGRPLTEGDVKQAFEAAIRRAKSELPPGFSAIRGATDAVQGKTGEVEGIKTEPGVVEIHVDEALPIYPVLLTDPRTAIARFDEEKKSLFGTGPFRLTSHEQDKIVLERNADYWKVVPPLDSIEFRIGLSAASMVADFRSEKLDIARDLQPDDMEQLLRDPRFHDSLIEAPQKFTYYVLFNALTGPVASNPAVRQVLSSSIRARDMVWRTIGRFAVPAAGIIPPGILGHDPGRRPHMISAKEAQEMLRAAGLSAPIRLKAAVHPLYQDRYASLLEALLQGWSELGIQVEIATSGTESYLRAVHDNAGMDLLISRWKPDVDDPDSCSHALFHSATGLMRAYFSSPETDQILEAARKDHRPGVRENLYRKFETVLLEAGAVAPLFHDIGYRVVGSKVKGIRLRSIQPCVNYPELGKAEAATPIVERRTGGVVRVPMTGRVERLDPMIMGLVEEVEVLTTIYETLMRDVGEARIEPWLASDFKVEEGGRVYRFHLRNDLKFHDGRRVSVRDVRYSMERLLQHKESSTRGFYAPIRGARPLLQGETANLKGFHIHSTSEFSIELEQPLSFFPVLLAAGAASIVPEGTGIIGHSLRDGAVGTGPFRVVRFEPGKSLELERNPYYWRKDVPKSERLIFNFGMSPENILQEFKAGRVSLAADLYPPDVSALRRDPAYAAGYRETPRLSVYYAAFNLRRGPLQDRTLRKQVAQAFRVSQVVKQTLGALAIPAQGLIPPGLLGSDPLRPVGVSSRAQDREVGKPSLDLELTAVLHPVYAGEYSTFFQEVSRAFRSSGVRLKVVGDDITSFKKAIENLECDLIVGRWLADYPDADSFAFILDTQSGLIGRLSGTPEADRLIAQGRTETDPQARHSIYRQLEDIISREALVLPLFHEQVYRFARPEVEGLSLSFWSPTVSYENLAVRSR